MMMKKQGFLWKLMLWLLVSASIAILSGYGWVEQDASGLLPEGMKAGSLDIGGQSPNDALKMILEDPKNAGVPASLGLLFTGEKEMLSADAISLAPDTDLLLEKLQNSVLPSGWDAMVQGFSRQKTIMETTFSVPLTANLPMLTQALAPFVRRVEREPVSASAYLDGNILQIVPEVVGRKVHIDLLTAVLQEALKKGFAGVDAGDISLDESAAVWIEKRSPGITEETLSHFQLLGNARVKMADSFEKDADVLAKKLNGIYLRPGESIDLKAVFAGTSTSLQSADSSSRAASAFFIAAIALKDVQIEVRKSAPYTTNYTEPGQEAILDADHSLVVRNAGAAPWLILSERDDRQIRLAIFSVSDEPASLVFSDVVETVEPPVIFSPVNDLEPNETRIISPGRAGLRVNVYRITGKERILLHTDEYPPQNRILEKGIEITGKKGK